MNPAHSRDSAGRREVIVDCDKGREMGCRSFCCALIVRLEDDERDPTRPHDPRKHCIDKDPETGRCIHQEPETGRCRIWDQRPRVCRQYDCNTDENLQIVLRNGFKSLIQLVTAEVDDKAPKCRIPYVNE